MRNSDNQLQAANFGVAETDITAQNEYDSDGKNDIAVWCEINGVFYIQKSSDNEIL